MTNSEKKRKPAYKKPIAIKELEKMAFLSDRIRHPLLPVHALAPRKFRDDSANGLTACIVSYIGLKGGFASRINNGGIYDKKLNKYRPGTSKKGLPDIISTYKGLSLHIEVKYGKDIQSNEQKKIESEVSDAGGLYYIARNFNDFKIWFDALTPGNREKSQYYGK